MKIILYRISFLFFFILILKVHIIKIFQFFEIIKKIYAIKKSNNKILFLRWILIPLKLINALVMRNLKLNIKMKNEYAYLKLKIMVES